MNRSTLFLTLSLTTSLACPTEPEDPLAVDNDGDGFSEMDGDCDDTDGATFREQLQNRPSDA